MINDKDDIQIISESNKAERLRDEATAKFLEKALKAEGEGDKARSDIGPVATKDTESISMFGATTDHPVKGSRKNTTVGGTNFHWGDKNSHEDVGFTPYFEKNITKLKGPIPLTIFNKAWQDAALSYHAEKRTKTDDNSTEKGLRYTGYPYPSEWLMNYSDWSLNYEEFTITIRDVYKFETLGEWIVLHKANCDKILRKDGFMTALRYDIRIRANAFAHRVVRNGVSSFSDISMFRQEVYDTAYAEARRFDELSFCDSNPYAIGGVRSGWDPHTGSNQNKKASGQQSSVKPTPTGPSGSTNTLPPKPRDNRPARSSGYQGKNFNPNYAEQRQGGNQNRNSNNNNGPETDPSEQPYMAVSEVSECQKELPVEGTWPSGIECDMNIPEWKKALEKANLTTEFEDVLLGFEHGFCQGIPQHHLGSEFPFFVPPNHSSALLARAKIEESIAKEIQAKRMFGPYSPKQVHAKYGFFRANPLGAVINGDGSFRAINDLSFPHGDKKIPSVNSFVNKDEFKTTWDDYKAVARFLRARERPSLLAIFDWEKAYRQILTAENQWPYLMLRDFDGNIIIDTKIAFGGVAGCGSFGRPADAWKHIMLSEFDLVEVFRWVDDYLFVKELESTVEMDKIVKRSDELGVRMNPTKISPFKREQKYIGFIWDAHDKTVHLPEEKLAQRITQIGEFLETEKKFSFNEVEALTGQLNHVSYMLPQLRCYLCGLYRWMCSWVHRNTKLPICKVWI
ncbi:uncharacterized protein PGTG_21424 [Puccinia graminis f. sp. tritici CRL 75-36-700-3]|uniref:Reverse transcriptase domain-containing protein n=1 Tax=Puccinia graminis f. sp. tritici (strain CRL 75-36-700-3 / race SCCL) TaxID=418459 RepID=H6QRA3_PUCGT|nr:uncharacterized protein PGTG_21424 [Puccinia graminis f. sp. tritici CRL 75-36-700-3]EHS63094.1 hypothetical protein PGTG_21424 [Puccinia graminis f. sp. tritici CRL 75-36-700-3]